MKLINERVGRDDIYNKQMLQPHEHRRQNCSVNTFTINHSVKLLTLIYEIAIEEPALKLN
jgi:hypothetical protein